MQIQDNTFFVTGGGSGLGAATARALVARGANVVLNDLNAELGLRTAAALAGRAFFVKGDVASEAEMQQAFEAARTRFGALSGLINCAGVAVGERVLGKNGPHRLDSFRRTIEINLIGTFNALRLAAHAMSTNVPNADGERGVIVNTASIARAEGQIGQAAYSASKAGVDGMTLPIARELARFGIRVVTIAPGVFETPMMAGLADEVRASLGTQVPFPARLGRPDEFAQLVLAIVDNAYINGTTLRLDGAMRMAAK